MVTLTEVFSITRLTTLLIFDSVALSWDLAHPDQTAKGFTSETDTLRQKFLFQIAQAPAKKSTVCRTGTLKIPPILSDFFESGL